MDDDNWYNSLLSSDAGDDPGLPICNDGILPVLPFPDADSIWGPLRQSTGGTGEASDPLWFARKTMTVKTCSESCKKNTPTKDDHDTNLTPTRKEKISETRRNGKPTDGKETCNCAENDSNSDSDN